jgi:hypothetical protein
MYFTHGFIACWVPEFNTYSTHHLCISDKYTYLCEHSAGKETEVLVFQDEEKEQVHVFHAAWEAECMVSASMSTSRAALPFLDFLLTLHLLLKQADITNTTNFHMPFLS